VGVVNLAVLACVLRTTTKKVVNLHSPRKNPGYAYAKYRQFPYPKIQK